MKSHFFLKRTTIFVISLIVGIAALYVAFSGAVYDLRYDGSPKIEVRRTSSFNPFRGGLCAIAFNSELGVTNRVDFYQNLFNSPAIIVPGSGSSVFFCVYHHDIDLQLIRLDLSQPFQPLSENCPVRRLVRGSTCRIERVSKEEKNDWDFVAAILERMSYRDFKRRVIASRTFRIDQKRMVASLRNFGDQGQYPDEVVIPSYMKLESLLRTNR